jgi:hypothetical protein
MANIVQSADGALDIEGFDRIKAGFVAVTSEWLASSVDKTVFTASRRFIVKSITARVEVAGTDAGAVTCVVRSAASGTAITSGTALHSGSINLKGTAATVQDLTLSTTASELVINDGTSIALDFTGTLTSATGAVTILLAPA